MKYETIVKGEFISRENRFIAYVNIDGEVTKTHVKNTGRCKELLIPGASVYLEDFRGRMGTRKLEYSLIAVEKQTEAGTLLINMDSQAPNKVAGEALASGLIIPEGLTDVTYLKSEYTYGKSRIDFYAEDSYGRKALIEVKGVTLEDRGVARFPDAPTQRGVKHVHELIEAGEHGYAPTILFVIQMEGMKVFEPNWATHKEFGDALVQAKERGVSVIAYQCHVTPDTLQLTKQVDVKL